MILHQSPLGDFDTLTPDLAFQHCANAAAAIYESAPPFVTYRVSTHVSAPSMKQSRMVDRAVVTRTKDDLAVIQDLPKGANQLGHSFPVSPVFDALSYFVLSWRVGWHQDLTAYVQNIQPLKYADRSSGTADVVVISLRQYRATYATDSSDAPNGTTHLNLEPYDFVKRLGNPDRTFYYSDVYIDNATGLPASVRFAGADDKQFIVDSKMIDGHWVVDHIHYEETLHGPLRIGRLHVIADANFDQFAFPQMAPDARLQPPDAPRAAEAPASGVPAISTPSPSAQ